MCDVGKALATAFSPVAGMVMGMTQKPDTSELDAAQTAASGAAGTAEAAITTALAQMRKASMPVIDNPDAMAASKDQMRKLASASGAAWSFRNTPTAAPATATRMLTGQ